ncbi:unnamed protein product, partial [Timema podura]|nr:unnamed protein product [Timema podura]
MGAKFGVFKEPRGVMRILQFIFSICAFATTTGFTSFVLLNITCGSSEVGVNLEYSYPFRLDHVQQQKQCSANESEPLTFHLVGDFSSDAQFFVATEGIEKIAGYEFFWFYVISKNRPEAAVEIRKADWEGYQKVDSNSHWIAPGVGSYGRFVGMNALAK